MADNKQLTRKEHLSHVSDLYKDVYGIRPRGYKFEEWTNAELNEFWDDLIAQLAKNNIEEEKAEKQATIDMDATIQNLTNSGAQNRTTALRWLITGYCPEYNEDNQYITGYEIDGFLYSRGISPFNDYGKKLRSELLTIAQSLYKRHHQTEQTMTKINQI